MQLTRKDASAGLPGERHPGKKRGLFALHAPLLSFERVRQRGQARLGRGESLLSGSSGGFRAFDLSQEAESRELFEGIIDLRSGDGRPISDLAPLEFGVR